MELTISIFPPPNNHYTRYQDIQTFKDLITITRVKIDAEMDTIVLNKYSSGEDPRDNQRKGNRSHTKKRGGSNAPVNRTGFHNNSLGGKGNCHGG